MTAKERLLEKGWLKPDIINQVGQTTVTAFEPKPITNASFVEPIWYWELQYALISQAEPGACLFGPAGTGKSTAIRQLAQDNGVEWVTCQCYANMQDDSLVGQWTAVNGSTVFVDGPGTQSIREDKWLIVEESNAAHPGVWSRWNSLLDRTGESLLLPSGERLTRGPNWRMICLYNEAYTGMREVNTAMKRRLVQIHCTYPDRASEIKWVAAMVNSDDKTIGRCVDVVRNLRESDLRIDFSPDLVGRWINLKQFSGKTWRESFNVAILNHAGGPEVAMAQRAAIDEIAKHTVDTWSN